MKNKKGKKKFIDLDIKLEKKCFIKMKTINTINSPRLNKQDHYSFFIIYNNNKIQIYEKKELNLLQSLNFNDNQISFCFIISNDSFIICTEKNISKVYKKSNEKFEYLKSINFPCPNKDIIPYEKNKIIFSTYNGVQIWNTINNVPSSCISIIKIDCNSFVLMKNKYLLVPNLYYGDIFCFDIKKLKMIKYIKESDNKELESKESDIDDINIYNSIYKIDDNKILINKTITYYYPCNCIGCAEKKDYCENNGIEYKDSFRPEYYYERKILKIPEFNEISDFFDECNEETCYDVIVFNKKQLFILFNEFNLYFYDLLSLQNIKTYRLNIRNAIKISDECLAVIPESSVLDNDINTIEFWKII